MDPNQSQPTLSAPPAGAAPVPSLATTQQPGDAAASGPAPQPGSGVCRIAVAQMTAVGDQQANYDTCARLAKVGGKGVRRQCGCANPVCMGGVTARTRGSSAISAGGQVVMCILCSVGE